MLDLLFGDLLFVYGTLRQGNANAMAAYLSTHAEFLTGGWFQGLMYQISYYPGVIASDCADDRIYGEVYRLHDAQSTLAVLDDYEECSARHRQPAEYQRLNTQILAVDGHVLEQVWIYLYQWPLHNKRLIESGDFMQHEQLI
ncbi:gamma-glutamylcyclotransferase [Methylophilus sp. Q8]|uniref:gamma-glutamylcyclotransferase family protein n=1 Tax=Methylophilus sp. Q8 TaxID=1506586 RepID=UPI0006462D95|nr:gamma-glutamylcyclotransferase family protein [Methylophilus sp. Q8]